MPHRPRIEPGETVETDCLVDLWEASVRRTHEFLEVDDIDVYRPLVAHGLSASGVFVYRGEDGNCLGFIALDGNKVDMLFVDPSSYGQGIGTSLLKFARERCGALDVDVNEQNVGAAAFYQRRGFQIVGRTPTDPTGRPYPILHMRQSPDT